MNNGDTHRYDGIINLPHHRSETHPHMSAHSRAAQFSPFAALVGYDDAVEETARLTGSKISLSDDELAELDRKISALAEKISERPEVTVTYFKPDELKDGGEYVTVTKGLKKIDEFERCLVFTDRTKVTLDNIFSINNAYLSGLEKAES